MLVTGVAHDEQESWAALAVYRDRLDGVVCLRRHGAISSGYRKQLREPMLDAHIFSARNIPLLTGFCQIKIGKEYELPLGKLIFLGMGKGASNMLDFVF